MFLPENYQVPESTGKYLKLKSGKNTFRILTDAVVGYEIWIEDSKDGQIFERPVRAKTLDELKTYQSSKKIKHFWCLSVWNYELQQVQLFVITQKGIQTGIMDLFRSEWGDPKNYDITINKTGEKMETRYNVFPNPIKPLSPETIAIIEQNAIDPNTIFEIENAGDSSVFDEPPVTSYEQ